MDKVVAQGAGNKSSNPDGSAKHQVIGSNLDFNKPVDPDSEQALEEIHKLERSSDLLFAASIILIPTVLFVLGNRYWSDRYYTPEEGLGYWLGLIGGSMMLIAYGYTLFKYVHVFRSKVVMKYWLTIHVVFGIVGPLLVIFHSTFRIGSVNGAVALISMIIMYLSGVIARFIYSKTHNKLDGKKTKAKDLQNMLSVAGRTIQSNRIDEFTKSVLSHNKQLHGAFWHFFNFGWRSRVLHYKISADLNYHLSIMAENNSWDESMIKQKKKEFHRQFRDYIVTLKKVSLFNLYERFFTFWRNAHVPLAWLLFMSGIVHVVAVHMY